MVGYKLSKNDLVAPFFVIFRSVREKLLVTVFFDHPVVPEKVIFQPLHNDKKIHFEYISRNHFQWEKKTQNFHKCLWSGWGGVTPPFLRSA